MVVRYDTIGNKIDSIDDKNGCPHSGDQVCMLAVSFRQAACLAYGGCDEKILWAVQVCCGWRTRAMLFGVGIGTVTAHLRSRTKWSWSGGMPARGSNAPNLSRSPRSCFVSALSARSC